MLNGIYLGHVEFNSGSLHDVPCNGACEQAADEFRHFDHGDVVQQAVDRHAKGCEKQSQGKHHDHFCIV